MAASGTKELSRLESAKHLRGTGIASRVEKLLASLRNWRPRDPDSLIRFHDALLFLRAFPQSTAVARDADSLLACVYQHVSRLREAGADMSRFAPENVSGIAGTSVGEAFTYEVALWLTRRYPKQVRASWDVEEQAGRLGAALPRFIPLMDDDCLVEADTPYLKWIARAAGQGNEVGWLLRRIQDLPIPIARKTELYDALDIELQWELGQSAASRTLACRNVPDLFLHRDALIRRNQVSLQEEFSSPPLAVRKLSSAEGEQILDMCRDALTIRYRELHGSTRGDPSHVWEADAGRGVKLFVWGLPPERRLPLRAYHAGFTLKNGVPVNYFEGISLFDWFEIGFNTFYAYRDGETAWIYSKVLHLFHQLTGVNCISVYPYQLGHENEEAIESGAFWFYRKLGFRPGPPDLLALAQREERKIAADPKYRTRARTLRKLATGHMFYEIGPGTSGLWDTFSTRNLGLAVQQKMAEQFAGNSDKMLHAARARLGRAIQVDPENLTPAERSAFDNFAFLLWLVSDLDQWEASQQSALAKIILAKAAPDETDYLRLLQQHARLLEALVSLGSQAGTIDLPIKEVDCREDSSSS
jgi:hypothetical protein